RAVLDVEVGLVLARLLVGVLRIGLVRIGGAVAELPRVLQRRLAAFGVRLELDGERRLAFLGAAVGPREERALLLLALLAAGHAGGRTACRRRRDRRRRRGSGSCRLRQRRRGRGGFLTLLPSAAGKPDDERRERG